MIDEESRNHLIAYRVEQAKLTAREADILMQNNLFRGAINRIYYAMFYMLQALSLQYRFESSKHAQLLGWFNKNFIHSGKVEVKYSKTITKAYNLRTKGDYASVYEPDKEEIELMFEEMKEFINRIEQLLCSPQ